MIPSPAISTVAAWHAAVAARDPDRVAQVLRADVEVVGPRGSGFGVELVQEWIFRSGIRLEPRRWFTRNDQVVVEQAAQWPDPATGDLGAPVVLATAFAVKDDRISRIARYPDLDTAFAACGLSAEDEQLSEPSATPPTHP